MVPRREDLPPATRLFGVETEYGFAALDTDGQRLDPESSVDRLFEEVRRLTPHLYRQGKCDMFSINGSRVYLDYGLHPEVATPEVSTPEEAILFTRAGDHLLVEAARAMERNAGDGKVDALLWKANVDHHTGSTWASHESYLHEAPQWVFADQLISHLVTRILYTGAGGFDSRSSKLRFVLSPRALHLEYTISEDSTRGRGIFHTRDEPLAKPPNRRLHVLAGESLWSETADYLRIGTTALLVAQIDAGRKPQTGLDLASPLKALATIANDVCCTAELALKPSGRLTAIAVQRRLLESVEADLGSDHLPEWAGSVCRSWRDVLDRLETSPSSLVGVLDWPTKLAVLQHQCVTEDLEWTFSGDTWTGDVKRKSNRMRRDRESKVATRLRETDMNFNRLDDRGIFDALDRKGALNHHIVSPRDIQRMLHEPPSVGRARIRSQCVRDLAYKGSAMSCDWDRVIDHERRLMLDLGDPFQSECGEWVDLPAAEQPFHRHSDPVAEPVERAIEAGERDEALRLMYRLLTGAEPPSLFTASYFADVIGPLVPGCPVPVIDCDTTLLEPVLAELFSCVTGYANYRIENRVGTMLYRLYEANAQYARARKVIRQLIVRTQQAGNHRSIAVLITNLGYEYLLEGRWDAAEPHFDRAATLFSGVGWNSELPSVRANWLECRFERTSPARWVSLVPLLRELNHALSEAGDWRVRKTRRLLARYAAHRGRSWAAIGWARRAIDASEGISTRLRERDHALLQRLVRGGEMTHG